MSKNFIWIIIVHKQYQTVVKMFKIHKWKKSLKNDNYVLHPCTTAYKIDKQ